MKSRVVIKTFLPLIVLTFCLCCLTCENIFAEEDLLRYGNYRYRIADNKVTIVDYGYDLSDDELSAIDFTKPIVIPDEINGMKVIGVEKDAFEPTIGYSYKCKAVKCSDYMSTVDLNSFNVLSGLSEIRLGKYTKRFLSYGRYQGSILELSEISLPDGAKYLKVAKNGALYSKNGKVLYAVPQKKKGSLSVSKRTKTIYKYAFCMSSLKTIRFPKSIRKICPTAFKGYDINSKKTLKVPSSKVRKYKKALKADGVGLYLTRIIKY